MVQDKMFRDHQKSDAVNNTGLADISEVTNQREFKLESVRPRLPLQLPLSF